MIRFNVSRLVSHHSRSDILEIMVYEMVSLLLVRVVPRFDRQCNTFSSFVVVPFELKLCHYHRLCGPKQPKGHHKPPSFPPLSLVVELGLSLRLFPPLLVPLHVEGEVVRPGEAAVALAALEGLDAGVLPQVPRQLVRPREPPLAAVPGAPVRLLT